jgi:hypothetical protein
MKKNTASQIIGAQMVAVADGSAFTGSVTVYVTGDGGTQAVGSVSSGACTHEGNGFHTYGPAQGETNYDHVAFTFIGSGAIPATIQIYPSFPQTADAPTAAAIADAVWDEATSGHVSAGTTGLALGNTDLRGSRTVVRGTVSSTSPSTTQFTPSALSPAGVAADQFKGRIIVFDNDTTTTALRGQATDITANTAAGLPVFTYTALTTAPQASDTFSIV